MDQNVQSRKRRQLAQTCANVCDQKHTSVSTDNSPGGHMPDCYERCYENEEEFDLFDIEDDYDDYYDDYSNSFDDFGVGCDLI